MCLFYLFLDIPGFPHVEAVKSYRGGAAEFAPAISKVSANPPSQLTSA